MPIVLKTGAMKYKKEDGTYGEFNALTEQFTNAQIQAVQTVAAQQISAIQQKGQQTRDSVPDDYTTLADQVSGLKGAFETTTGESVLWEIGTQGQAQRWDSGSSNSNSIADNTKYTDISAYKYIRYMAFCSSASNTSYGIAFYTGKTVGSYISGVQGYSSVSDGGMREQWAKVPDGAVYARFTVRKEFDGFFIEGYANFPFKIDSKINDAISSFSNTIAPAFSETNSYNVGDYVYKDGTLYVFTSNHITGPWIGTDAVVVVLSEDVNSLKDVVADVTSSIESGFVVEDVYNTGWVQGTLRNSNGTNLDATNRCRSNEFTPGSDISQIGKAKFTVLDGYKVACDKYNKRSNSSAEDFEGQVFAFLSGTFEAEIDADFYYRFVVSFIDDADLTPENVPKNVVKFTSVKRTDDSLSLSAKAADAKVTGNMFKDVISSIGNAEYEPDYDVLIGGGVASNGNNTTMENRARTQYIRITPGNSYLVELSGDYSFYNSFTYGNTTQGSVVRQISIIDHQHIFFTADSAENYFRVGIYYTLDKEGHVFITDEKETIKALISIKRVGFDRKSKERTGTNEWFTVSVDRPLSFGKEEVTTGQQEIECVLRLPSNYNPGGTPTRLILACHGAHGYVDSANNTWYSAGWTALTTKLLNAGYAIFGVNVLPTSTGADTMGYCVGSPLAVQVAKKAYDYIQQNYNVYREIFVHGTSMGGTLASAFAKAYPGIVLAESSFAGRDLSLYIYRVQTEFIQDSDTPFAMAWGYNTMAELKNDKWSHIDGTAPVFSLLKYTNGAVEFPPDRETNFENWMAYYSEIQSHGRNDEIGEYSAQRIVPYKAWDSWADDAAQTKAKLILQKAFRRSGSIYEVVTYDDYTHDEMSFGKVADMRNQLIAWYKRWE